MNRIRVGSHFPILTFFLVLLGSPLVAPAAQSGAPSAADMQIDSSEQPQVQEGLDVAQEGLDWLNTGESQPPPEEEPPPDTPFGEFENYLNANSNAWYVILTKLVLACVLGLILAIAYRVSYTGKKKKYSRSMMQTQLLLCVGGALIWVIVANYLVRAFGLAGMVGLIRYRTPVRDPKDNVTVFLSMAIGMACGLGQVTAAVVATGFISLVLLAMHAFGLGKKKKKKKEEST